MSSESENLALVSTWCDLYNKDVHRLIDELYAEDAVLSLPGILEISDKNEFHKAEQIVLEKAPDRKATVLRSSAKGDNVTAECVLSGTDLATGEAWQTYWCAILTFRDGRIVSDRSYVDHAAWPGAADVRAALAESRRSKSVSESAVITSGLTRSAGR